MPSYCTFCDPSSAGEAQAVRYDYYSTFVTGNISGCCSSILGGIPLATPTNNNSADLSVILMGDRNSINTFGSVHGMFDTIANGCCNEVCGCFSGVYNGWCHNNRGCYNDIVNGYASNILGLLSADSCYNTIGNGYENHLRGSFNSIPNGACHIMYGTYSFIGTGCLNRIGHSPADDSNYSFLGSGACNAVDADYSFLGSGFLNVTCSSCSVIGGGTNHLIDAANAQDNCYNVIGGGCNHYIASGSFFSSIFSGECNQVYGACDIVGGGQCNYIGCNSAVGAGLANFGVIGGGQCNCINGSPTTANEYSFIGGGSNNVIDAANIANCWNVIGGGCNNYVGVGSYFGSIFSGECNIVCGACSVVAGGQCNYIGNATTGNLCSNFSFIGGGQCNQIDTGTFANTQLNTIGGGWTNYIGPQAVTSTIAGGEGNQVWSLAGFVGGGASNCIMTNAPSGVIGGGDGNCINPNSQASFIGGGTVNHIGSNALGANGVAQGVISGGSGNCIDSSPATFTQGAAIGGGNAICIGPGGNFSAIAGGEQNSIWGVGNSMGGGVQNTIGNFLGALPAQGSFIGGGYFNCIDSNAAGTFYGAIGGGQNNLICAGVNFGSILGGQNNTVAGNCSAIFGGCGNSDGGLAWAGVFGCNVVASFNCAFHTNQLAAPNTTAFSTAGGGLLQYFVPTAALIAAGIPATACIVLIS